MPPARRDEVRAWLGLGVAALALAGGFALLLAISRVPGIESSLPWPVQFFEKGLVIHVVFSFVVWFLTVFAALVTAATPGDESGRGSMLGQPALMSALAALILLGVPALLDRGEASLNNYVPVIIDPLYYAGLAALAAAVAAIAIRFWMNYDRTRMVQPLYRAVFGGSLIFAAAVGCILLAWLLNIDQQIGERFNEDLFWGGGHALQFLNTLLMITAWWLLAEPAAPGARAFKWSVGLATAPAVAMPLLYVAYPHDSGGLIAVFTDLQYLLVLPAVAAAAGLWRGRRPGIGGIERLAIMLSMAAFVIGGVFGLFVDGADTRTPAHYHAVIAAVNLGLIGLVYTRMLPWTGRARIEGPAARLSLWGYGAGQMIAAVGLFMAGGYGAPRKTAGDAQGLEELGAQIGLYMNGVGALIAVVGGVIFIWLAARALLRPAT